MKWWFWKKKDKDTSTVSSESENKDFDSTKAPTSNSDFFEFLNYYIASNEKTLNKTGNYLKVNTSGVINQVNTFINERTLSDWFLLQLQANYYTNTIKFKTKDPDLYYQLRKMIWAAFIYGKSGLFYDSIKNSFRVVLINEIKYKKYIIEAISVTDLTTFDYEIGLNENNYQYVIKGVDLKYLFIFNWGVNSQSALIYQYPFIRTQSMIFTQLIISSLLLGKKVSEKVQSPNKSYEEIKTWLDPKKFFVRMKFDQNTNDKIEIIEKDINQQLNEIEFYKEFQNFWYALFGRRVNVDYKKERQITGETDLIEDNINNLELEWKNQFKIFVDKFNNIMKEGYKIEYEINRRDDEWTPNKVDNLS